jgi:hypothetical protein
LQVSQANKSQPSAAGFEPRGHTSRFTKTAILNEQFLYSLWILPQHKLQPNWMLNSKSIIQLSLLEEDE